MGDIRLLQGADVRETLQSEGELAVYRYSLNTPVFTVAMVVGAALLALGGFLWWTYGFTSWGWSVAVALPAALGLGIGCVEAYWYYVSETHFVAVSADRLFVGKHSHLWCIDWELLDRESLGFEEMSVSSVGGSLELNVARQSIPLRLYSAFVQLDNIQGFMYQILQHLNEDSDLEESFDGVDLPDDLETAESV